MDQVKTISEIAQNIAVILAVVIGGLWTVYLFVQQRTYETILEIDMSTKVSRFDKDHFLVFIEVLLKNKSKRTIDSKPKTYLNGKLEPVYRDGLEIFYHSVSIKIRRVETNDDNHKLIDWHKSDNLANIKGVPDEINLLSEFEISKVGDTDFWLEPDDTSHLSIVTILPVGHYIAKVTFIGKRRSDDFWSRIFYFKVPVEQNKELSDSK